jgi:non-heme chloroperoxidase
MPRVAVEPGVRLHVEDSGGPGRTIVFLHGWPLDSRQWEYQFAGLQPLGYRCVAIDSRGFGRSDHPWGHYDQEVFADDLRRVVDILDLDDFAVVGLSLGAGTALRYVESGPGRSVTHLVVCGGPTALDADAISELVSLGGTDRPTLLRHVVDLFAVPDPTRQWLYDIAASAMPYATRRVLELLRDGAAGVAGASVRVPTLLLHGAADQIADHGAIERLHSAIPGSRLVTIATAGHGAFVTHQGRFNDELVRFVGPAMCSSPRGRGVRSPHP